MGVFAIYDSPLDQKKHFNETTFFLMNNKTTDEIFSSMCVLSDIVGTSVQQRQRFVFCFHVTGFRGIPC